MKIYVMKVTLKDYSKKKFSFSMWIIDENIKKILFKE